MGKLVYLPFNNFFPVEKLLVTSEVFMSLSNSAKNIYFLLWTKARFVPQEPKKQGKGKRYFIANNGQIVLLYSEIVERCGYASSTISKAINELLDKGFIDITRPGIGICRLATRYAISERWRNYGKQNFEKCEINRRASIAGTDGLKKMHEKKRKRSSPVELPSQSINSSMEREETIETATDIKSSGNDGVIPYIEFQRSVLIPLKANNPAAYLEVIKTIESRKLVFRKSPNEQLEINTEDPVLQNILARQGDFPTSKNRIWSDSTTSKNRICKKDIR